MAQFLVTIKDEDFEEVEGQDCATEIEMILEDEGFPSAEVTLIKGD